MRLADLRAINERAKAREEVSGLRERRSILETQLPSDVAIETIQFEADARAEAIAQRV